MQLLNEVIQSAHENKTAIGHFNISTIDALCAVFDAVKETNTPVIIGVSEGERKFIGVRQGAVLVKSLREEFNYPIFINADHTYSFEGVKEAIRAGFDAVIFDGASLPLEENIRITKQCVEYARSINPEIVVEGELGYIGKSSALLDTLPQGVDEEHMTTAEDAKRFVRETGVDLFAPSVGNVHGMLKHAPNPRLHIDRIRAIEESVGIPLVLHGGSGIRDEDFTEAIRAGVSIVHINTEIRKGWRDALRDSLEKNPDEIAPYKLLAASYGAVRDIVKKRSQLFSQ